MLYHCPPMHIEDFKNYCEKKQGSELCFPFNDEHMVFKVGGKMFAIAPIEPFGRINLKCEPQKARSLRAAYSSIIPGWHMNKKHWNTVILDDLLPDGMVYDLIDHSYALVFDSLSQKQREPIVNL